MNRRLRTPARVRFLSLLLMAVFSACANDVYIASSAAGTGTGLDCADAYAYSYFNNAGNWTSGTPAGEQIGPGTTVHVCGTITFSAGSAGLIAQGSGSSGSPVIVTFEPGSILQAPYLGGYTGECGSQAGCKAGLEIYNRSYIIVDGGASGVIQNTANGTDLANQQASYGVFISGDHIILRSLTVQNIYLNDPTTNDTAGANTGDILVQPGSTNITICNNTLSNARIGINSDTNGGAAPAWPLPSCSSNTVSTGVNIFGNTLSDNAWHIHPAGSLSPIISIFNNTFGRVTNWNEPLDAFHTDGIIATGDVGSQLSMYVFGNYFQHSAYGTTQLYCTYGDTASGCTAWAFNNIFEYSGDAGSLSAFNMSQNASYQMGPFHVFNNTFVGVGVALNGGVSVTSENNLVSEVGNNYFYAGGGISLPTAISVSDYNDFYGGRGLSFSDDASGGPHWWGWPTGSYGAYSNWTSTGFDTHSVSGDPKLDGTYHLGAGSAAIGKGINLSSLCSSVPPLCYDKAGVARPSAGAWDIGAYQSFGGPAPPTGLQAVPH
jgi:hypothetical protein